MAVRLQDVVQSRVLVTRESARSLGPALAEAGRLSPMALELDLEGVEGITPSFLDETFSVLEELLSTESDETTWSILIVNPPTRLSAKFLAVARSHGLEAIEREDGAWVVTASEPSEDMA